MDYAPYGTSPEVIFQFGWSRDGSDEWEHLSLDGEKISTWTYNEEKPFHRDPNGGVNADCTLNNESLTEVQTVTCKGHSTPRPEFICR